MAFLPPTLRQRYFNAAGEPLAGGKIWSYQAGTTTPLPTFTDKTETTQNANPYVLDANGEGQIWLSSVAYKIVLMDANDVVQWTVDNVRSAQNATFEAIQPMTTKGDIITHTGSESTRRAVGAADTVLTSDSTETTGLAWRLPHPLTAKGDLFTRGSAIASRLAVGANGQVLTADSAETTGLKWAAPGAATLPTVQRFTSGSGTYTTPGSVRYLRVRMVGGGSGGNGGGTGGTGGAGAAGGNSTFGSSLLTANGGSAGGVSDGSPGGSTTVSGPAVALVSMTGSTGDSVSQYNTNSLSNMSGANGASSVFGGAAKGVAAGAGLAAAANSGSGGGGGGGAVAGVVSGGGGGAGGYVEAFILTPSATYSYAVGAGGAGGTAGTSGFVGGAGGSGIIIVEEYY